MEYAAQLAVAQAAAASGHWQQALDGFRAALALEDTAEATDGAGRCLWWLGEVRASIRERQRAFTRFRETGDDAAACWVALDLSVYYLTSLDNEAAARGWLARATRVAAAAAGEVPRGWLLLIEGFMSPNPENGVATLERALEHAATDHDRDLELVALADLGLAHVAAGRLPRGFALLDEAMAGTLGGEYSRLETVVWASGGMLAACSLVGDLVRATQWCSAADAFTEQYGCPFLQSRCRAHYGRVLVSTGRWDRAEPELREALRMSAELGAEPRVEALAALAELRLGQGRVEEAEALLAGLDAAAPVVAQAGVDLARGHPGVAVARLRAQLPRATTATERARLSVVLAEALMAAGDASAARAVLDEVGENDLVLPETSGRLLRVEGLLAAGTGDRRTARSRLEAALAAFRDQGLGPEVARTQLELARLVAPEDQQLAVIEATEALARLDRLGARGLAAEAAALLRSLGVAARPGPREGGPLTRREREVLDLLEAGLSNLAIAERLFISRKTAAHHVSSILQKLALETRAEAAAWSARRRAVGGADRIEQHRA